MRPLAGISAERLVALLAAFRSGAPDGTVMQQLAKGYSDEQLRLIAAWFAAAACRQVRAGVDDTLRHRRRLLGAGAALAATAFAGCAGTSRAAPPGRVAVVGGGYGGATAARYLKLWGGSVEVTLVERQADFVSCPISNLVLGGSRQMADLTSGYAGLRAAGVRVLHTEAAAIDVGGRRLRLGNGGELAYDRLVLSPGIDFIPGQIGGLDEALASGRVLHAWKAGPQTLALRRRIEAMPDGGVFAMCIPRAPYRGPPAPYERACVVAGWLKANKPRAKLLVLDANPEITSKKGLFEAAFKAYAGLLEYRPNCELRELAGDVARLASEDVRADVLNVIPPQRAGDLARAAGLLNVDDRWVGVDWLTLEARAAPGIHVLGDAVFSAPGMPNSPTWPTSMPRSPRQRSSSS